MATEGDVETAGPDACAVNMLGDFTRGGEELRANTTTTQAADGMEAPLVIKQNEQPVHSPQSTASADGAHSEQEVEEELDDLGTPAICADGPFGGSGEGFEAHRFVGPSLPGNDHSARELHGLRTPCLSMRPPKFVSAVTSLAQTALERSESGMSSSSSGSSHRRCYSADHDPSTYRVSFTGDRLGFHVATTATGQDVSVMQVISVEQDGPAFQAGVGVGDAIVSINGEAVDPHLSEDEILQLASEASESRAIVFSRCNSTNSPKSKSPSRRSSLPLPGKLTSAFSYGTSMLGSALLKRKKAVVHKAIMCDGCGVDPIVGCLWTCSVCPSYHLCNECYELGTHGMEETEDMQLMQEALMDDKLQKKCKHYTPDFLTSLRCDVCKGRLDKFEYLGLWIADIVNPTPAHKIAVRGIEIPQLHPDARQRFVSHLMPLVSNRRDIEVNIEWFPDDSDERDRSSIDDNAGESGGAATESLEKLRIWISDKKKRTASPFI